MATTRHVKINSGWKNFEISPDLLSDRAFESLISCKVITDYEIIDPKKRKRKKTNENESGKVKESKIQDKVVIKKTSRNKNSSKSGKDCKTSSSSEIDVSSELLKLDNKEHSVTESSKERSTTKKKQKLKTHKKLDSWTVTSQSIDTELTKQNTNKKEKQKLEKSKETLKNEAIKSSESKASTEEMKTKKKKRKRSKNEKSVESYSSERKRMKMMEDSDGDQTDVVDNDKLIEKMAAWKNFFVPKKVLQALYRNKFFSPTPIQAMTLPSAIRDKKDIVGAAETGSGKTLAFGIPVIHNILAHKEKEAKSNTSVGETSDVVFDTDDDDDDEGKEKVRGLDEDEDKSHDDDKEIEELFEDEDDDEEVEELFEDEDISEDEDAEDDAENKDSEQIEELGCVKVIDDADFSALGFPNTGPSLRKCSKFPLALILQPTRELAIQVKDHLQVAAAFTDITIAPIVGGMSAEKQKRILKKCPDILVATPGRLWELMEQDPYLSHIDEVDSLVIDEADRMIEKGHFEELTQILAFINRNEKKKHKRQTFVFSATLTLVHAGPQRSVRKKMTLTEEKKLETLMSKIQMREKPKVIDLTRKIGTVETLTEARINCTLEEKDLYLYYFLTQYPGRTLIFANSKDCIRRLVSILTLLKTDPLPLHADMHQKQRLKNLERFTANDNAVLLASDVAARGLDIPNVEHVIHYQVPQTVENYVHRSGRTARAMKEGLSVMLISPEDVKNYRKITHTLNRSEDLPVFPVEYQLLSALKKRLNLAKRIDVEEHRFNKKKRQNEWFEKAAKEMDMLIDDEELLSDLGDSFEQSGRKQDLKSMKTELDQMLKQRLAPQAFTGKYLTQSGKLDISADEEKKDALKVVKKDRKLQHKLLESIPSSQKRHVKKKSKWKKKK
ncbi:ATP-dependent RNA helicase DDX24-like [Saccostrea echinata]|uniref:ATP-dependent RNA helicase DDX24-like n=1 Tax=Saccostrea echinata TaxID=191078 RepID=UPI002A82F8DC|nr:ATP-dependent RNA helicase DDX24-like [Saccostrea echinata]